MSDYWVYDLKSCRSYMIRLVCGISMDRAGPSVLELTQVTLSNVLLIIYFFISIKNLYGFNLFIKMR